MSGGGRGPYFADADVRLFLGDCVDVMRSMEPGSVDAVVCDPPYELGFMGKGWDSAGVAFDPATWGEAYRVLKPGGHLLAFGGTRTFHRIAVAIEDAGFEVRDCLSWLYGQGFPKSLDVSKAIDKAAGAEREVVGTTRTNVGMRGGNFANGGATGEVAITAPATDAAREWQGWGTALKPAWEPCIVARRPLAGTVAENVQRYGTGAVNVDGCRIAHRSDSDRAESEAKNQHTRYANPGSNRDSYSGNMPARTDYDGSSGRWPANVALDEAAAAMLDEQSGVTSTKRIEKPSRVEEGKGWSRTLENRGARGHTDTGGASRFFYVAKASKSDRGEGNTHPTVKPTALMRWLVRMVTPPGGVVLDPFAGSGTTLLAARMEGLDSIGIEREEEYADIIVRRLGGTERTLFSEAAR